MMPTRHKYAFTFIFVISFPVCELISSYAYIADCHPFSFPLFYLFFLPCCLFLVFRFWYSLDNGW